MHLKQAKNNMEAISTAFPLLHKNYKYKNLYLTLTFLKHLLKSHAKPDPTESTIYTKHLCSTWLKKEK